MLGSSDNARLTVTVIVTFNLFIILSSASHHEKHPLTSAITNGTNDIAANHGSGKNSNLLMASPPVFKHHFGSSSNNSTIIRHNHDTHLEPRGRPKLSTGSPPAPAHQLQTIHEAVKATNETIAHHHVTGNHHTTIGPIAMSSSISAAAAASAPAKVMVAKKYHKHFATRKVNITEKLLKFNMYLDPICHQIDTLTQKQLTRVGRQLKQFSLHTDEQLSVCWETRYNHINPVIAPITRQQLKDFCQSRSGDLYRQFEICAIKHWSNYIDLEIDRILENRLNCSKHAQTELVHDELSLIDDIVAHLHEQEVQEAASEAKAYATSNVAPLAPSPSAIVNSPFIYSTNGAKSTVAPPLSHHSNSNATLIVPVAVGSAQDQPLKTFVVTTDTKSTNEVPTIKTMTTAAPISSVGTILTATMPTLSNNNSLLTTTSRPLIITESLPIISDLNVTTNDNLGKNSTLSSATISYNSSASSKTASTNSSSNVVVPIVVDNAPAITKATADHLLAVNMAASSPSLSITTANNTGKTLVSESVPVVVIAPEIASNDTITTTTTTDRNASTNSTTKPAAGLHQLGAALSSQAASQTALVLEPTQLSTSTSGPSILSPSTIIESVSPQATAAAAAATVVVVPTTTAPAPALVLGESQTPININLNTNNISSDSLLQIAAPVPIMKLSDGNETKIESSVKFLATLKPNSTDLIVNMTKVNDDDNNNNNNSSSTNIPTSIDTTTRVASKNDTQLSNDATTMAVVAEPTSLTLVNVTNGNTISAHLSNLTTISTRAPEPIVALASSSNASVVGNPLMNNNDNNNSNSNNHSSSRSSSVSSDHSTPVITTPLHPAKEASLSLNDATTAEFLSKTNVASSLTKSINITKIEVDQINNNNNNVTTITPPTTIVNGSGSSHDLTASVLASTDAAIGEAMASSPAQQVGPSADVAIAGGMKHPKEKLSAGVKAGADLMMAVAQKQARLSSDTIKAESSAIISPPPSPPAATITINQISNASTTTTTTSKPLIAATITTAEKALPLLTPTSVGPEIIAVAPAPLAIIEPTPAPVLSDINLLSNSSSYSQTKLIISNEPPNATTTFTPVKPETIAPNVEAATTINNVVVAVAANLPTTSTTAAPVLVQTETVAPLVTAAISLQVGNNETKTNETTIAASVVKQTSEVLSNNNTSEVPSIKELTKNVNLTTITSNAPVLKLAPKSVSIQTTKPTVQKIKVTKVIRKIIKPKSMFINNNSKKMAATKMVAKATATTTTTTLKPIKSAVAKSVATTVPALTRLIASAYPTTTTTLNKIKNAVVTADKLLTTSKPSLALSGLKIFSTPKKVIGKKISLLPSLKPSSPSVALKLQPSSSTTTTAPTKTRKIIKQALDAKESLKKKTVEGQTKPKAKTITVKSVSAATTSRPSIVVKIKTTTTTTTRPAATTKGSVVAVPPTSKPQDNDHTTDGDGFHDVIVDGEHRDGDDVHDDIILDKDRLHKHDSSPYQIHSGSAETHLVAADLGGVDKDHGAGRGGLDYDLGEYVV